MPDSLNIVHTVEFYHPHVGGSGVVVQQLSERLARRGHRVTVATTRLPERTYSEHQGVKIEPFEISGSVGNGLHGPDHDRYRRFLCEPRWDVMMNYACQQWATDLAFEVLDQVKTRRTNVICPCGYSALSNATTMRWHQFTSYFQNDVPRCLPLYDAAVYHSAHYQDYEFAKNHGFANTVVIPNAAGEEEFLVPVDLNFREHYGVQTRFFGLCVANFYHSKGQDVVIECVRQMQRPDFTMVFVGKEGDELPKLRTQAAGLNVQFCVNIPRQHTVAAYRQADVFVFGSLLEAAPLVIIEAKAARLPFVSTDCGNVREWQGGIVRPPRDLPAAVISLLDDGNLRKELGAAGFKEWKEKLTWSAITDRYEELYLRNHRLKRAK